MAHRSSTEPPYPGFDHPDHPSQSPKITPGRLDDNYNNDNYIDNGEFASPSVDLTKENIHTSSKDSELITSATTASVDINDPESAVPLPDGYVHPESRPLTFKSTFSELACIFALAWSPAMGSFTNGALLIALPRIGDYYGIAGGPLSWTLSSFALSYGSFMLLNAKLADIFGRKRVTVCAYLWFAIFSLGAGFCKSYIVFFVLRALMGIGASAAVPSAVGILGATYLPSKRKNMVMATFGAGAPIGFVTGIVCGGICTQFLTWQSNLYFFTILWGSLAVCIFFTAPDDAPLKKSEVWELVKTIDYGGAFLTVTGFTFFIFALSQAETAEFGWKTPYIIGLLVAGLVIIGLFCVYEAYIPAQPLMPLRIWLAPGFSLCMVCIASGWMNFQGILAQYNTLYFENIRLTTPMLTTAYFVPQAISGVAVCVFAAMTMHIIPGRILMIASMLGFLGAALLWAFIPIDANYWAYPFPSFILVTIGADLAYNICNLHALNTVSKDLQSTAAGVFNTTINIASAIGLAASAAIVSSVVPDQHTASREDLLKGYHAAFYLAIGVSGVGLIASVFLKVGTTKEHGDQESAGDSSNEKASVN